MAKKSGKSKAPDLSFNFGASAKKPQPRQRGQEGKKSQRYREHVLGIPSGSSSGGT